MSPKIPMPAAVNDLARLLPLRQLGQDNARIIARAWTSRHLRTGDVLWEQEAPDRKSTRLNSSHT